MRKAITYHSAVYKIHTTPTSWKAGGDRTARLTYRQFSSEEIKTLFDSLDQPLIVAEPPNQTGSLKAEPPVEPPSAYVLELLVPMPLTADFLLNLTEIYETKWVPQYGHKRARWLWHRQCAGLIVHHWFDVVVGALERFRKAFYSWG